MNYSDKITSLLDDMRHVGALPGTPLCATVGSVKAGSAVQFQLLIDGDSRSQVRYHAFGSPILIAVCEYWARSTDGRCRHDWPVADVNAWMHALGLQRDALAQLLLIEDAWRALIAQLA